jgi:hypothetical protein
VTACVLCRRLKRGDGPRCAACVRAMYWIAEVHAGEMNARPLDAAGRAVREERLREYERRAELKLPLFEAA